MPGVRRFKRHERDGIARLMTIKVDASRLRFFVPKVTAAHHFLLVVFLHCIHS